MMKESSPAEAPAAAPSRQPARWVVLAAVLALLALASRGLKAEAGVVAGPAGSTVVSAEGAAAHAHAHAHAHAKEASAALPAASEPSAGATSPAEPPGSEAEAPIAASLLISEEGASATASLPPGDVLASMSSPPADGEAASAQLAGGSHVQAQPAAATPAPAKPGQDADAPAPECQPTPLSPTALAEALREGHIRHFGSPPHADRWACAWAQCAFEQDWGGAIYGNNLGHLTARSPTEPGRYVPRGTPPARPTGRVCLRRMRERLSKSPDRWALVDVWFRVFDTPAEGAEAYWRLLANSYHSVLARCDEADARGAAQRLADIGYFTGPEEPYINGMSRLFLRARGSLIPRLLPRPGQGNGSAR